MSTTKLRDVTRVLKTEADVHLRRGTPTRDSDNKKGIIYKDFEVEIVEEWRGEAINGNDLWYRDKNGDFLWAGAFGDLRRGREPGASPKILHNYNQAFTQIPARYRTTKGNGITVAVLDSGIQVSHEAFNGQVRSTYNAMDDSEVIHDNVNHGTHVTGIIGARNAEAVKGLIGIAPECELHVAKLADDDIVYKKELKKGLRWALDEVEADVVNMSLSLQDVNTGNAQNDQDLIALLDQAVNQNIVLVASAGQNYQLLSQYSDSLFFPAWYDQCISAGVLNETFFNKNRSKKFADKVNFICPMEKVYSSFNENAKYGELAGSSMAAGIITGMVAVIRSAEPGISMTDLKTLLADIANPVSSSEYSKSPLKVYRP